MDISKEKEIGRILREMAEEEGLKFLPGGFQLIVDIDADEDDKRVNFHLILSVDRDELQRRVEIASKGQEQYDIDSALAELEKDFESEPSVSDELRKRLDEDGGFL